MPGGIFDLESKEKKIQVLELEVAKSDFWNNNERAREILAQVNDLKSWVTPWQGVFNGIQDVEDILKLMEEEDPQLVGELEIEVDQQEKNLHEIEFRAMLGGKQDKADVIVSINAGAGGTESCDWAEMLLRMYKRWAERHGFKTEITDILTGEEAGIKSVTFIVRGDYAFGYLKAERGVHRLVRISPFDASKRRHTSFASVDAIPQVEANIQIDIQGKDLRIDTYRASGAGGQHVNKTDSAVRITHLPTNTVVQCQNDRSQIKNRATAMKILRARLYELEQRKKEEALKKEYGTKEKIEWGSQIRSYVLHPYNMVKDHRSNTETSNTTAVLDGEIDSFIEAYLKTIASS